MKNLLNNLKESVVSVLPIAGIVLVLGITIADLSQNLILKLVISTVLMIIGMSLFTLGADIAIVPMGNAIGSEITKTKKIILIVLACFLMGTLITIAEPDLWVLAEQLSKVVSKYTLVVTIGIGSGIFLVIAMLRIVFQVKMRTILFIFYGMILVLAFFTPKEYLAFAFDSGGVTTGPISTPFIMALGIGIAATKGSNSVDDSFGILALCSTGPILAVLLLGFTADPAALAAIDLSSPPIAETGVVMSFLRALPDNILDVTLALAPVLLFVIIFNFTSIKMRKKSFLKVMMGFLYVFIGIIIFLVGINQGFAPVGRILGEAFINKNLAWLLIPIGFLLGFFIVIAEPAVHVLSEQVEEISGGTIKKRSILIALMLAVAVAIGLALVRVLTGISMLWMIVPGYSIAIALMFFVPKVFTAIAFDSGGVASGTMTAAFLLPFATGASFAKGGNPLTDAFGMVAIVAMMPLITIQLLGLIAHLKMKKLTALKSDEISEQVIDFDEDDDDTLDKNDESVIIDFDNENSKSPVISLAKDGITRAANKLKKHNSRNSDKK